jgi:hypothetical protein
MCLLKLLLTFSNILDLAEFSQFGGSQFFGQEDAFDETSRSVNASEGHASDKTNEGNLAVTDRVHNGVQPADSSRNDR